jgi:WhiB family redox-sensing transcriptional regulator
MTTHSNTTGTGGNRGNYDYMQLLSEFALVLKDFAWMDEAACRNMKDVNFFPEEAFNSEAPKAVAVCRRCPVREDCLEFAVENHIQYGIWGGLSYPQRKRYLRNGRKESIL